MTFEYACSPFDYILVESYTTLLRWLDGRSLVTGISLAQTTGISTLTSGGCFLSYEEAGRRPGNRLAPPFRTYDPGIAVVGSAYTTDYGKSWQSIGGAVHPNAEKVFSSRFGFIGKGTSGDWYADDPATKNQTLLAQIPTKFRSLRAASNGTLVGFGDSLIAWMGPTDTSFVERRTFSLPGQAAPMPVVFLEEITWRDEPFFCLATTGIEWYLFSVSRDSARAIHLQRSVANARFVLSPVDEFGCLITETDRDGRPLQNLYFDRNGVLVSRPETQRCAAVGSIDQHITWSDSAVYVIDQEGNDASPCHLYRIRHREPNRVEHVGKAFTGEAGSAFEPMSMCVLDTMNGSLVGRDRRGAVLEYTTGGEMRGFLIHAAEGLPEQKTAQLNFEHSVPQLITTDTVFALGTSDVIIGTNKGRLLRSIWVENNPVTMLQRAAGRTLYFGRRDIIQASYDGQTLDTIEVRLPGVKGDTLGVLSDIAEIDTQNLVLALRGHTNRTYDGELLYTTRGGLAYTTDRGATWQFSTVPSADQAYYSVKKLRSGALVSLSVDADILVDSATNTSTVRCTSGHLLRSIDGGKTWTSQATFSLRNPSLSRCSYRIWEGTTRIFIATPEAVMISTDDGQTWTAENDFPLNCIINGVAEHKGQLYVATTMGIYRENQPTSVREQEPAVRPAIRATATRSDQAWRISVTGLPTLRITGVDAYDIQGRHYSTEQMQLLERAVSFTSPLPSEGIYGIVIHGENGQRWATAVGVID
ncbi:MAG: exo-alpha-sialidase [Candidatus Kapabacteria bacterium]|nr:exo-alpha-sialidase [Candidatus Kapabacteria bacterium]